jgi:Ca-activated chloride channel family protein
VLRPEFGKVNPVSITIHLEAGFPLGDVQSVSHAISVARNGDNGATIALRDGEAPADRDFALSFAARSGAAPSVSLLKQTKDGSDYLLALVLPPTMNKDFAPRPRETIFVLDNSGSMAGESIRQAKASLLLALDRLKPADRFNVIRFDNTLTVFFPRAVDASPANVAAAKGYVNGLDADGGTEMLPALLAALNDETPSDMTHLRQVIFLTDGDVGNEAELFSAIAHKLGRTRLFTVGIGSAPNSYFMSGAARAGRGTYTYIGSTEEVAPRMAELFAKLERPVMTDLTASWPTAQSTETWPNPLPDLYDGQPVVLTARTTGLQGDLVLSGKFDGKPWQMTLDLAKAQSANGIEKLWARNKIAALEDSRVLGVDTGLIDHAVLDVALAHHLTSRLTSLVAVDVTPSRPLGAPLSTQQVALNLPAGWDFDKVFGEDVPVAREEHAEIPAGLLHQLVMRSEGADAVQPEDVKLVLPQGGTDSRLLMIVGGALLALALMLMRGKRTGVL